VAAVIDVHAARHQRSRRQQLHQRRVLGVHPQIELPVTDAGPDVRQFVDRHGFAERRAARQPGQRRQQENRRQPRGDRFPLQI